MLREIRAEVACCFQEAAALPSAQPTRYPSSSITGPRARHKHAGGRPLPPTRHKDGPAAAQPQGCRG